MDDDYYYDHGFRIFEQDMFYDMQVVGTNKVSSTTLGSLPINLNLIPFHYYYSLLVFLGCVLSF